MRLQKTDLAEAITILVAVGDGVLADSLRFSLELEGFDVKLCDEFSLPNAMGAIAAQGCLVLDQEVFARLSHGKPSLAECGMPVVLLVGHKSERVLARAKEAGVTKVVETPLLGTVLSDAIVAALDGRLSSVARHRPA
jgi:FixJ family two-component response regulator